MDFFEGTDLLITGGYAIIFSIYDVDRRPYLLPRSDSEGSDSDESNGELDTSSPVDITIAGDPCPPGIAIPAVETDDAEGLRLVEPC